MLKRILIFLSLFLAVLTGYGQVVTICPTNIGFENGSLGNWQCYAGEMTGTGPNFPDAVRPSSASLYPSEPLTGRHTLIKRGSGKDAVGGFSLDAPNGSDYVIRLGNSSTQRGAESISYTLNVPSNVDTYSIIFNYAVVFQNPDHDEDEQPRFTARIIDAGSYGSAGCGSFTFVAPGVSGAGLPGFKNAGSAFYKPWSPVMVNLTDYRGRTVILEFTTNDCSRGGHYGYAYIDFNENCSIPITGNVICSSTQSVTLKSIPGFLSYNWYNMDTKELVGTSDSLLLSPAPLAGTKFSVELIPYDGLGCTQTLYTVIKNMDMYIKDDLSNCIDKGIDLTDISIKVGNSSDLTYTYWTDKLATKPLPDPKHIVVSGVYYIKGLSSTGCFVVKPVTVIIAPVPSVVLIAPTTASYSDGMDLKAIFNHLPGITYSYWADKDTSIKLKNPAQIRVSGTYFIKADNNRGCENISSVTISIVPDVVAPNTFTPNGDGINDVFTFVLNTNVSIKSFKIIDRWGETVFATSDISNFWDGFKRGAMIPIGVYFWILEGTDNSQKKFLRTGPVTVLR